MSNDHDFNDVHFKAARVLLNRPTEWDACDSTTRNEFWDAFGDVTVEESNAMRAGEIAEHVLLYKVSYLRRLRFENRVDSARERRQK